MYYVHKHLAELCFLSLVCCHDNRKLNWYIPSISVPSQGHYGFHSFPVVD